MKNLENYQLARDRQRRQIRRPSKYGSAELVYYVLNTEMSQADTEPISSSDAVKYADSEKWIKVMDEEMESSEKNNA